MKQFLIEVWRTIRGVCPLCGGRLNRVYGFGPKHSLTSGGVYVWCPSCHSGCTQCAKDD